MESKTVVTSDSNDRFKLIRNELSEVSFEELQKLQETLGTKIYEEAMFGNKRKQKRTSNQPPKFNRLNKNRPQEISSKKTITRRREVVPVNSRTSRDPRFDDLSGEFKEEAFNQNYSFLKDIRKNEQEQVQKEIKKAQDTEKQAQLKNLLQKMKQKEKSEENKQRQKEMEKQRRAAERELIKQGKKPFYLKKSEKRKAELTEKYKMLKESGKLDTYIAKRRKKNASKQRKHFSS
ncbi:ribosomal RNA processing protein 36 homolog [Antedon mediterranea]|uniref:ribosomal RNA processing protein 36 homolog n=1 Tax=Antedon mediterranea TaxID=105859 RepID=UPI003AF63519